MHTLKAILGGLVVATLAAAANPSAEIAPAEFERLHKEIRLRPDEARG